MVYALLSRYLSPGSQTQVTSPGNNTGPSEGDAGLRVVISGSLAWDSSTDPVWNDPWERPPDNLEVKRVCLGHSGVK